MSKGTLYDKVWDRHTVTTLPTGQTQLFVGLHLIHEVTSPQAFGMLRERGLDVAYPKLTHATVDHIVPTADQSRPYGDDAAETMMAELEENVRDSGIVFDDPDTGNQGIVHVIGPEQGITQPGMTIVCGDSHTSTHGAFGALAFGIGTSQIRDVLATGTIAMEKQKVRKIEVTGELSEGVTAKDIILTIIRKLGTDGGVGYVYEYAGEAIENLGMEGRMSICNMSIEGGARAGYVNPDETTYEWLEQTDAFKDEPERFAELKEYWESISSDDDAEYDDVVTIDGSEIEPVVTWGTTPARGSVSPSRFRNPKRCLRKNRRPPAARWNTCASNRASRWRAIRSMSPSSAPVRTPDCPICAQLQNWSRVERSTQTFERWSSPAASASRPPPRRKVSTRSSRRLASTGAVRVVRCVSA